MTKRNSREGIRKVVGDVLMEGSRRYPYARTCAFDLFGMTPDDYLLDGWQECAPLAIKTTLQRVKSTLEENMRRCSVEDVIDLIDEMINQLNEEEKC